MDPEAEEVPILADKWVPVSAWAIFLDIVKHRSGKGLELPAWRISKE